MLKLVLERALKMITVTVTVSVVLGVAVCHSPADTRSRMWNSDIEMEIKVVLRKRKGNVICKGI